MYKPAVLFLLAVLAVPAVPCGAQSVADPFTQYEGRVLEGRIQQMVASRDFFVLHRVIGDHHEIVESWEEGQLSLAWQQMFVTVGSKIVLNGFRVAFEAAETLPASRSVGLHIVNVRTGSRIHYSRGAILGHAGRFLAVSGDSILDMEDGSVVFGSIAGVRRVRFLATIGANFLLLVAQAPHGSDRRPVLYDPVAKRDLWADKTLSSEMVEFLDRRLGRADDRAFDGFPVVLAERAHSRSDSPFRFMLLTESGGSVFFGRTALGLSEPGPFATIDFAYLWSAPEGPRRVVGVNARHLSQADRDKLVIAVFDPAGTRLAQTIVDLKTDGLAWTGLDPAGRLLAFVNRHRPRREDLILSFALPSLARTETPCPYNAQVNAPPALIENDLFMWDEEPLYPPGAPVPAHARMRRPLVVSVDSRSAAVTSYYPLDDATWKLMSFAKDKIRHVYNDTHLFLPFASADRTQNRSLILPIPRQQVKGWLNASFRISPEPVYTDADETIAYTPASATVTVNTGRLDGLKWRSPHFADTTFFTLTLGGLSQRFQVPILARPVNQPPLARFKVLPREASADFWSNVVRLDASASSDPDGRIVSYSWNFGDQTSLETTVNATVDHVFNDHIPGEYRVIVTVTDDGGQSAWSQRTVNVPRSIEIGQKKYGGPASVQTAPLAGYDVDVTTGSVDGAGTNAKVYVTLYGPLNADGERTGTSEFSLNDSVDEAHRDAMESGHTDVFKSHQGARAGLQDSSSLDTIEFLTLRHDNSGERPGWFVRSVKVRNQVNRREWYFEPNVWLDTQEPPLNSVMGRFTPVPGTYPRGLLFGGTVRSWAMIEASDNVFILPAAADTFYFTALDRAIQIEVFQSGVLIGRQYPRGTGIATPPYIPSSECGVEVRASTILSPTRFSVTITRPGTTPEEAFVWVFPAGWKDHEREARSAALVYPLKGGLSFLVYGDTARQFMSDVYTFDNSLTAALGVVMNYASTALAIFGGPGEAQLEGTIQEQVGIFVAQRLNTAIEAVGMTLASSVLSETIGLFEAMIKAREWAQQLESVQAQAAATAGGLQYLGRLAACNPLLLATTRMLAVIRTKLEAAVTKIDANDPAGYQAIMADVRMLAVGKNPNSTQLDDYLIDYAEYGIVDPTTDVNGNPTPADNYCLSMACLLEYNNIQRWKSGGIGPCFPSDVLINWTDAEKIGETKSAMVAYEPLFRNIMRIAGVAISIALLP